MDWVQIDAADGWLVLAQPGRDEEYVREMVAEAKVAPSGWLEVTEPSPALVEIVRAVWSRSEPGMASEPAERIAALLAHYSIDHHLRRVGARVLNPRRAKAFRKLAAKPELAAQRVRGYLGYAPTAGYHTLMDLLLEEGSSIAAAKKTLDVRAFDRRDVTRLVRYEARGQRVEDYIARARVARRRE